MTDNPSRKRIVVVDDDPIMRDLYDAILSDDFEVQLAEDGEEGLELARKAVPDLAIIDVNMPKMHGFELCRRLRAEASLAKTRIMFVSAKSYEGDIKTAKEIGADEYMVKPFEAKVLLETVRKLLAC
ncbi:MAG: response regulator transcription factor [Elusimicrobia bacterium]|nr:response regulator transcription factor [Elusimicrobiota bacterium]